MARSTDGAMGQRRPFRFGVQGRSAGSRDAWIALARKAEDLGFATLLVPDHIPRGLGPIGALATAAAVTNRLRIGSFVFANDFRHPALLAKEAATLDLLSEGRFELGIGAGWDRSEYREAGLPFDPAGVRIERLEEAARLLKRLFGEEPVSHVGTHYAVTDLALLPRPVQQPRPPLLIGGGGRKLLSVAAREADIIGLSPRARMDGTLDPTSLTAEATARKIDWVHEAARDRLSDLEINVYVYAVEVTKDRRAAAERLAPAFGLPAEEILGSPHALIGPVELMTEQLQEQRERYGISYVVVGDNLIDALAPVIARVAGT